MSAETDALREFVERLGAHDGPCVFDGGDAGACSRHAATFEARRAAALRALETLER